MATIQDLRAAEPHDFETTADAAASVIRSHRHRIAEQLAEISGAHRIAEQIAEISGAHRIAEQIAETLLAPKLREFHQQAELLAEQLGSPAQPVDGGLHGSEALAWTPSVDWLLLSKLTVRAMILASFLVLVIAVLEEQADTAPAQALIDVLGALFLWNQIDEAVWKKFS
jgi:hypothetical protein